MSDSGIFQTNNFFILNTFTEVGSSKQTRTKSELRKLFTSTSTLMQSSSMRHLLLANDCLVCNLFFWILNIVFFQLLQISLQFYVQQLAESSGHSSRQASSCSSKEELTDFSII